MCYWGFLIVSSRDVNDVNWNLVKTASTNHWMVTCGVNINFAFTSAGLRRRRRAGWRPCAQRWSTWWTWGSRKRSGWSWRRQRRLKPSSASCPSTLWSSQRKTRPYGNAGASWAWMLATLSRCWRKCLDRAASRRRWLSAPFWIQIQRPCQEPASILRLILPWTKGHIYDCFLCLFLPVPSSFLSLRQTMERLKSKYQQLEHELEDCREEVKQLQTKHREVLAEMEAHRSLSSCFPCLREV